MGGTGEEEMEVVVVAAVGRAEIDTRAPFQSVKEAVVLFGEKVLAGEAYANKLKEIRESAAGNNIKVSTMTNIELEEAKESLRKAIEEGFQMANCLSSLKEELEQTKREMDQLRAKELEKQLIIDSETEDLKFVKNPAGIGAIDWKNSGEGLEFQRRRYVKFASLPLAEVMGPPSSEIILERHHSLMKKKKKSLIPLIGGLFSKKKKASVVLHLPGLMISTHTTSISSKIFLQLHPNN